MLADIVQIQVCSNQGPRGSGGATIGETIFTCVYIGKMFKNLPLKNYLTRKFQFNMEACWHSADSSLLKSWPPGVGRGHNSQVSNVAHGPLVGGGESPDTMYLGRDHRPSASKLANLLTYRPGWDSNARRQRRVALWLWAQCSNHSATEAPSFDWHLEPNYKKAE